MEMDDGRSSILVFERLRLRRHFIPTKVFSGIWTKLETPERSNDSRVERFVKLEGKLPIPDSDKSRTLRPPLFLKESS